MDLTGPKSSPAPSSSTDIIKTEIESSIPIKSQNPIAGDLGNSIATSSKHPENLSEKGEFSLDNLLKDVNNAVKAPDQPSHKSWWRHESSSKPEVKKTESPVKGGPSQLTRSRGPSMPVVAMVVSFVVGGGLAGVAVFAFKNPQAQPLTTDKHTQSTVGTSSSSANAIQAAGGTIIKPGDLSDLSSDLQSKPATVNDNEDFNPDPLSDKTLGL